MYEDIELVVVAVDQTNMSQAEKQGHKGRIQLGWGFDLVDLTAVHRSVQVKEGGEAMSAEFDCRTHEPIVGGRR
jgi:hypothetical protein